MSKLHLIQLRDYPILDQLRLEEALLRADEGDWCLVNVGTSPAIVMGISGKKEELVCAERMARRGIPVIRRFSGGGTVVVGQDTIFVTFIFNSEVVGVACSPEKILRWTEELYHPVIGHGDFRVRENDYVIGDRKFGGNAQYMRKGRWLHHSSLLWDYDPEGMEYLLLPRKAPQYRQQRSHEKFLCKLRDYVESDWMEKLVGELKRRFVVEEVDIEQTLNVLERPHRKATTLV